MPWHLTKKNTELPSNSSVLSLVVTLGLTLRPVSDYHRPPGRTDIAPWFWPPPLLEFNLHLAAAWLLLVAGEEKKYSRRAPFAYPYKWSCEKKDTMAENKLVLGVHFKTRDSFSHSLSAKSTQNSQFAPEIGAFPKGKDRLPTTNLQGATYVSFRVVFLSIRTWQKSCPDAPWDGNIYPAISPCSCGHFSPFM